MDAVDMMPNEAAADDLQSLIQAARSSLSAAGSAPFMKREPYRVILTALGDVLGVFGRSVVRWERAVADVIAARDPLPEEDRKALMSAVIAAAEDGAYKGMRKEAARVIRSLDRRLSIRIGLCVGGAYILGVASAIGVLASFQMGPFSAAAQKDAAWSSLITNNPDPRPALAAAEIRTDQVGRRYYAKLSLWLDPAHPPPAAP